MTQITKLTVLRTQPIDDSIYRQAEEIRTPIELVFGDYATRNKALLNLIGSDAVKKLAVGKYEIVKDVTLQAANVLMRKGDIFEINLELESDGSPIAFDLTPVGHFSMDRLSFKLEQQPAALAADSAGYIELTATYGGSPVTDLIMAEKTGYTLMANPSGVAGEYWLVVTKTPLLPASFTETFTFTGVSLKGRSFDRDISWSVNPPSVSMLPHGASFFTDAAFRLNFDIWLAGRPSPIVPTLKSYTYDAFVTLDDFRLEDMATANYSMNAVVKSTEFHGNLSFTYDFDGWEVTVPFEVNSYIPGPITQVLETTDVMANSTTDIIFNLKIDDYPMTDVTLDDVIISGQAYDSGTEFKVVDSSAGRYSITITSNEKGGVIAISPVIHYKNRQFVLNEMDVTAIKAPLRATLQSTLVPAEQQDVIFKLTQDRLSGTNVPVADAVLIPGSLVITGTPLVANASTVTNLGGGLYSVNVTTNDKAGTLSVSQSYQVAGVSYTSPFSTTQVALSKAVLSSATTLIGETTSNLPFQITLDGQLIDMTTPVFTLTGTALVSKGVATNTGTGTYSWADVNVNGKGGVLILTAVGLIKGYSQTLTFSVPVTAIADPLATQAGHLRPTVTSPIQFKLTRSGVPVTHVSFGLATITGSGVASYLRTFSAVDAPNGIYQLNSATGDSVGGNFQISATVTIQGYAFNVLINSYTEAMKTLTVTGGANLQGGVKQDYQLAFLVDGAILELTSGTVAGSGTSFVSLDSGVLTPATGGLGLISGVTTGENVGTVTFAGSVLIDGITYQYSKAINVDVAAPIVTNITNPLQAELSQTLFFTLSQTGTPVTTGSLTAGTVTGTPVNSFTGFSVSNAASGIYKVTVNTNGLGGTVTVSFTVTINGTAYPLTFTTVAAAALPWTASGTQDATPGLNQVIPFLLQVGGAVSANTVSFRNVLVTGTPVTTGAVSISLINAGTGAYNTGTIITNNQAGIITVAFSLSTNGVDWHDLSFTVNQAQAADPTVTPGAMIPAQTTSPLGFILKRGGTAITSALTFSNVVVTGDPVASAATSIVTVAQGLGSYSVSVTTNGVGGNINVSMTVTDKGVDYPVSFVGTADVAKQWTAVLVGSAPEPEHAGTLTVQSLLGTDPATLTNPVITLSGTAVYSPTAQQTMTYADSTNKYYSIPNVIFNNSGGTIVATISGTINGNAVTYDLHITVAALPDITASIVTMTYNATQSLSMTLKRGTSAVTLLTPATAKNIVVSGPPIVSAGTTLVINASASGQYSIPSVVTNGAGGTATVSFTATLAGIDYPVTFTTAVPAQPPVVATGTNVLATNTSNTNLDLVLTRAGNPVTDVVTFVSVAITSRSVWAYQQTMGTISQSAGTYRLTVSTSAYSDPINVSLVVTINGVTQTLTFTTTIAAGTLPILALTSGTATKNLPAILNVTIKQGSTNVSGATLNTISGAVAAGGTLGVVSAGVYTLNVTFTAAGSQSIDVTYLWSGALYTSTIVIPVTDVSLMTLTGVTDVYASVATTVPFTMTAIGGAAFSAGATFDTSNSRVLSVSSVTRLGDGTYTMSVLAPYEVNNQSGVVIIDVTDGGVTTRVVGFVTAGYQLGAKVLGDNRPVLASTNYTATVYDLGVSAATLAVIGTVDTTSLVLTPRGTNHIASTVAASKAGSSTVGFGFSLNSLPDAMIYDFEFKTTINKAGAPAGVRNYTVRGVAHVNVAATVTWLDSTFLIGSANTMRVQIMWGATPAPFYTYTGVITVSNATAVQTLDTSDAVDGIYKITFTPSATSGTFSTMSWTDSLGNYVTSTGTKAWTAFVPATATTRSAKGASRVIGVILRDVSGIITDATITDLSGGTYHTASSGSWTCQDTSIGLYKPVAICSAYSVGSTTATVAESLTLTYTRGGQTYTVPVTVTSIAWPYLRGLVDGTIYSDKSPVAITGGGTQQTLGQMSILDYTGAAGQTLSGSWGSYDSGTGQTVYSPTSFATPKPNVTVEWSLTTPSNTVGVAYCDPIAITREPYVVQNPVSPTFTTTSNIGPYPAKDLPDYSVQLLDDQGAPLTGATVTAIASQSVANIVGPRNSGAVSTMMVPLTDGSDGRYLLQMRFNGWNVSATSGTFSISLQLATTMYPSMRTAVCRLGFTLKIN